MAIFLSYFEKSKHSSKANNLLASVNFSEFSPNSENSAKF